MSDLIDSAMTPIASPPSGNKGGPGVYNSEPGYPERTSSPNAVPEKMRDQASPLPPKAGSGMDKLGDHVGDDVA